MVSQEDEVAPPAYRVGPFDVTNSPDQLVLRLENRGALTLQVCLLFLFTMMFVLILGIFAVVQTAQSGARSANMDDPARFFSPQQNHFGFLWLILSLGMFVAVPVYVRHLYRAALVFSFRRSDEAFLRDGHLVTRLRKIEYLTIREVRDPDARYLYLLNVIYNDGQDMLLHNSYDEREIMNLANEIATFVGVKVSWKS